MAGSEQWAADLWEEVWHQFNLNGKRFAIATIESGLVEREARPVWALREARRIIAEIDDYMKRPERGDWGVECALCMGELLDDDRDTIARIDATLATLKDRQP